MVLKLKHALEPSGELVRTVLTSRLADSAGQGGVWECAFLTSPGVMLQPLLVPDHPWRATRKQNYLQPRVGELPAPELWPLLTISREGTQVSAVPT